MKKTCSVLKGLLFLGIGSLFFSCDGIVAGDTINSYVTTKVQAVNVTANAYPGVNLLTWNAVNDVDSYTVYRTVSGGHIEEDVTKDASLHYYYDTDIQEGTTYSYRIVAHPADKTVHDDSEKTVTLTTAKTAAEGENLRGTWAPETTVFSQLGNYEVWVEDYTDYTAVSAQLLKKPGNIVRASFAVKPYAKYTVYLSTAGEYSGAYFGDETLCEDKVSFFGFEYDKTATVDLTALYGSQKNVTVVATPLNETLYGSSYFQSSTISVPLFADTPTAVALDDSENPLISAMWTDSGSYYATARVSFSPYVFGGEECPVSEYSIYTAYYTSSGNLVMYESTTYDPTTNEEEKLVNAAIRVYGTPSKDSEKTTESQSVYYRDISVEKKFKGTTVRIYVVLNHYGSLATSTIDLSLPDTADSDWGYEPYTDTSTASSIAITDAVINTDGSVSITAKTNFSSLDGISCSFGSFSTKNAALASVSGELSTSLTVSKESSYVWTAKTSTDALEGEKYYVFRCAYTYWGTAVDLFIARVHCVNQEQKVYYWEVVPGYEPENYEELGTLSVAFEPDITDATYNAITIRCEAENAVRYFLAASRDSFSSYDWTQIITDSGYRDESVAGTSSAFGSNLLYYTVAAVGNYGGATVKCYNGTIKVPVVSFDSERKTLSWDAVSTAAGYYVYCAESEAELSSRSLTDENVVLVSGTSYAIPDSALTAGDRYFAVRAYKKIDDAYVYSVLSTAYHAEN